MSATCKQGSDIFLSRPPIRPDRWRQALESTVAECIPGMSHMTLHNLLLTFRSSWHSYRVSCHFKHPGIWDALSLTRTASSPSKLLPHSSGQTPAPVKTSHNLLHPAHGEDWLTLCLYTFVCPDFVRFCVEQRKEHLDLNPSPSLLTVRSSKLFNFVPVQFSDMKKRGKRRNLFPGLLRS